MRKPYLPSHVNDGNAYEKGNHQNYNELEITIVSVMLPTSQIILKIIIDDI